MSPVAFQINNPEKKQKNRAYDFQFIRKSIYLSFAEGSFFSLMVGLGETYLPAFIIFLSLGEVTAGLITTVPLLAGAIAQLLSPWMVSKLGSNKRWVLICASLQGCIFIPLFLIALWQTSISIPILFLLASLYWACGMGIGSAWNAWMGTIIPCQIQVTFFTTRTRYAQLTVLIGFVVGGFSLNYFATPETKGLVFAGLFLAAFICRSISLFLLYQQSEPISVVDNNYQLWVWPDFLKKNGTHPNAAKIFRYLISMNFSAHLAAPFFSAFMLVQLKLQYWQYAVLIAASYLTKVITLPRLGKIASRSGTKELLWVGGIGVVTLPALWLISHDFIYLIFIQALSGFFWAAFELATLLLVWEVVPVKERTQALTCYNVGYAVALSVSSILGGLFLNYFGKNIFNYHLLFLISTFFRGLTVLNLAKISSHSMNFMPMMFRVLSVRPSLGPIMMPIVITQKLIRKVGRKKKG